MHLKTLASRAVTLALATVTMVGVTTAVTAPAHAGQVGVTLSITGAGIVRVVEGTPSDGVSGECDATGNAASPTATTTCPRIRSQAAFEAWLWLRPTPYSDQSGSWTAQEWRGCNQTRVVQGVTECGVHSGAFSSDERTPSITFVDKVAPQLTSMTATPSTTADRTVTVAFTANEAVTAHCKIDDEPVEVPCSSPFTHTFATDGQHRIAVDARDLSHNVAPRVSRTFTLVDTVLEAVPPTMSADPSATFGYTSGGSTSFLCTLDGGVFVDCGTGARGSHTFTGLADGTHTVKVWGRNSTHVDPVPATHTWVVDTVAPDTTITHQHIRGTLAGFDVSSPGATSLECRLTRDGAAGAWTTCGPATVVFTELPDATYTAEFRGKDAAGNVDATPATHTWTVDEVPDTTDDPHSPTPGSDPTGPGQTQSPVPQTPTPDTNAPDTVLTAAPAPGSFVTSDRITLGWAATEATTTSTCTLDGAPRDCSGTTTVLSGLAAGTHRFTVAAVDAAGNHDATPATRSWTVPLSSLALKHGKGWADKRSRAAYAGSYALSRRSGAVLSTRVRGARSLALVASTGRGHGTVKVYAGTRLLRTLRLSARTASTRKVLPVATLPTAWSGKIRIVVARAGRQVRIEGLGVAS